MDGMAQLEMRPCCTPAYFAQQSAVALCGSAQLVITSHCLSEHVIESQQQLWNIT